MVVLQCFDMIKTITKIVNSCGIIFDAALLELAHLKEGDEVNLEVHSGGTITIAPVSHPVIQTEDAAREARRLIGKNAELFRRLS
jgi:antitoxin component of MazEF toxin-antitoxin module